MAMRITDETLMGTFEQKRELVRSFTMFDDDFFAVVMEDKAAAQEVLRVLTGSTPSGIWGPTRLYWTRWLRTPSRRSTTWSSRWRIRTTIGNGCGIINPILIFPTWIRAGNMRSCRRYTSSI